VQPYVGTYLQMQHQQILQEQHDVVCRTSYAKKNYPFCQ
jgi:hypothetical protein